jgi:hypothetical protein
MKGQMLERRVDIWPEKECKFVRSHFGPPNLDLGCPYLQRKNEGPNA